MDKRLKLLITLVIVAIVFGVLYFAYDVLSEKFAPDVFSEPPVFEKETSDSRDEAQTDGGKQDDERMDAPDFTVLNEAGEEVKLSDYFGKPIVLNFWATWCYYCKEEMPDFDKACKEYTDVQFLMVNATDGVRETVDIAKKYKADQGFDFPVLFDTEQEAVTAYYITGYPTTWFIDKDGKLVTYANSMLSYDDLVKGIGFITE